MTDEAIVEQFIAGVEEINNTLVNGGEDGFSVDFQKIKQQSAALKQNPSYKSTVGEHIDNKKKNRYKDILPFDTLRPKLPLWDGCTSDYINASLIKGPDGNHSYLASQGPLPHTVDDFWRLLWSFKVKVIVMVCREVEMGKRKCENYWSSDKNAVQDFGEISVKLEEDELNENGFHKRRISAKRGNETRTFHQLHYRNWPDHGVPKNRGEILSIIAMARTLQDYSQDKENPLCVHCSAGCGRTGAVLVIDYFRNLLLHKNLKSSMKVFDVVTAMRKQRPAIVQTKDQYEFVHLAVSELFANYLLSKGRTVSGLGKALTSTNYENITITPKAKREKKTSHRTDPQSSGKLQNNYQNIQLDHNTGKSPSSKTVASPDSLVPPPKPSRREGSLLQRPVSSIEPLTHHQTKQNMTNFRGYPENKKKMTDSSSLNAATGSLARTNSSSKDSISKHANLSNAAPAHDVDQRSSYPTPLLKPKPKLRSSSGSNTTRPENSSASVDVLDERSLRKHEERHSFVSESLQSRKERLWSHGMINDHSLLQKKPEVSMSVFDLRTIHESNNTIWNRQFTRTSSVDNDIGGLNANNCNNFNVNAFMRPVPWSSVSKRTPPFVPPKKTKPPMLPKKCSASVKISKSYNFASFTGNSTSIASENKAKLVGSFSKLSDSHIAVKTNLDVPRLKSVPTVSTTGFISTSTDSELSSWKCDSENVTNIPKIETTEKIGSDCSPYSVVFKHGNKFGPPIGPLPYRSPFSSTSSSVFEATSTSVGAPEEANVYFSINEVKARKTIAESTKPGCSTTTKPAPPLKPKRTFKKNRSPNVQKNQPVKAADATSSRKADLMDVALSIPAERSSPVEELYASPYKERRDFVSSAYAVATQSIDTNENHSRTYLSPDDKDQDRNDSEIFINSNPDYVGSRPKSSAVPSSPNQNALSSPSSPSLSKFPAPSSTSEMPPLPKRTPESYMLSPAEDTLDTADNCAPESCAPQLTVPERTPQSYILETEDETITCESQKKNNGKKILLDIPLTSEYAEVGFPTQPAEVAVRPSAANQSSNLGAKAKEFLYKTSNLFGGSSNSKVEDAAKSSHPAIHETNEDLSFPHRLSRKPKGPKPLPKVWSSK